MLCEGEKVSMTASSNGWPQMIAERPLVPAHHTSSSTSGCTNNSSTAAAGARVMDSAPHDNQQRQQQPPLRCPRCDSTNTKFCYYNNYSLSQPRHFCKACKRYWTRGGTLRNVPVGGGCRKNKRIKKPSSSSAGATPTDPSPPLSAPTPIPLSNPTHLSIPGRTLDLNPLLYGLTAASSDMGLIFPTFSQRMELPPSCAVRSSIPIPTTAYDLQPQLNALGLGFPSNQHDNDDYTSGIGSQIAQLQQPALVSSPASLLHDYCLVGSSLSTAPAASLLVSSLKQPKEVDNYQALLPYANHLQASDDGNLCRLKDVKIEHEASVMCNEIDWQLPCENPYETMSTTATAVPSDSSSSFYWNAAMGAWPDAANCGPSLTPLI